MVAVHMLIHPTDLEICILHLVLNLSDSSFKVVLHLSDNLCSVQIVHHFLPLQGVSLAREPVPAFDVFQA